LGPCATWRNFFGALSLWDVLRSIRLVELPLRLGLFWQFLAIRNGARREARILNAVDGLLGRTDWARATSYAVNPRASYFHVGEVLRSAFSLHEWKRDGIEPYTLVYTNAGHPRRGTEDILAAVAQLRAEF